jgi:hypothetical protein
MSKRIFLILLSGFAVILSIINCRVHAYAPVKSTSSRSLNIFSSHQSSHSDSINLNKDKNNKNAIRIKAWDDASAVLVSAIVLPATIQSRYGKPILRGYSAPICLRWFSSLNLRGPPQI